MVETLTFNKSKITFNTQITPGINEFRPISSIKYWRVYNRHNYKGWHINLPLTMEQIRQICNDTDYPYRLQAFPRKGTRQNNLYTFNESLFSHVVRSKKVYITSYSKTNLTLQDRKYLTYRNQATYIKKRLKQWLSKEGGHKWN